jgi:Trypsin-co-occurring domain 2
LRTVSRLVKREDIQHAECSRKVGCESEVGMAEPGIGLADAIALLRDELLTARAAGAGSDIQLPVTSMTVELKVAASTTKDGKAGFRVPIVNIEAGGAAGWQRETLQTVTVVFAGPVDRSGNPAKVAAAGNELRG